MKRIAVLTGLVISIALSAFVFWVWIDHQAEKRSFLSYYAPTVCLKDRNGNYLDDIENQSGNYGYWKLEEPVSKPVISAILAAEDKNFFQHQGYDLKAVLRAFWQNTAGGKRISGASTLAMQVVRLEYPGKRTYLNKLIEVLAANKMIRRYGHNRIIHQYLTIAPFGNRYHGIAFACEKYFHKPVRDLTLAEAALLCSLPKAPGKFNLYRSEGRLLAVRRARTVLDRMIENNLISNQEFENAVYCLNKFPAFRKDSRPLYAMHALFQMRKVLRDLPGGKNVYTSLDLNLQRKISVLAEQYVRQYRKDGAANTAAVVADVQTGEVLAYVGSANFKDTGNSGWIDYASTPRSPGSSLKPFLYALGMKEKGFTGATVLSDVGLIFPSARSIFVPENSDHSFQGPILYRSALANSRNIPAIQVLNEIGVQRVFDYFKSLKIVQPGEKHDALYYGLGLAVGSLYVTLFDLTRAYGILAGDGKDFEYSWTVSAAKIPARREEKMPADIARMITLFLSDPEARLPTFPRMGSLEYPFAVALKTGTSLGYKDAWVMAYTHRYVIGVWSGHPRNQKMKGLGGSNSSAYLLRGIMAVLHPKEMKGQKGAPFMPPPGYICRRICPFSGKLAVPDSKYSVSEWFKPGTEPLAESDVFRKIIIDKRNGRYAGAGCPEEFKAVRMAAFLPQIYADWAHESGIELAPAEQSDSALDKIFSEGEYKIAIREPVDQSIIMIDGSVPDQFQTISLKADVEPAVEQVVWYLDGKPYQVADYPYIARWPIKPGNHTFQVKFPYSNFESEKISVLVK